MRKRLAVDAASQQFVRVCHAAFPFISITSAEPKSATCDRRPHVIHDIYRRERRAERLHKCVLRCRRSSSRGLFDLVILCSPSLVCSNCEEEEQQQFEIRHCIASVDSRLHMRASIYSQEQARAPVPVCGAGGRGVESWAPPSESCAHIPALPCIINSRRSAEGA